MTPATGFVESGDGSLWAATQTDMLKIDPSTLKAESFTLGESKLFYDKGSYRPCSLAASKEGDAIYYVKGVEVVKESYGYTWAEVTGSVVCRFDVAARTTTDIYTLPAINAGGVTYTDVTAYASAIRVNPASGEIYVTYLPTGYYDYNKTRIDRLSADGTLLETINYTAEVDTVNWFPSEIVF